MGVLIVTLFIELHCFCIWQQRRTALSVLKSIHCTFNHSYLDHCHFELNHKSIPLQSLVTSLQYSQTYVTKVMSSSGWKSSTHCVNPSSKPRTAPWLPATRLVWHLLHLETIARHFPQLKSIGTPQTSTPWRNFIKFKSSNPSVTQD